MNRLRRLAVVAVSAIAVTTGYLVAATGAAAGVIAGHP